MNNIITTKPIYIDRNTPKTCINIVEQCGGQGVPDNPFVIRIKRAGTCEYLIEYDGVVEGNSVCFEWDHLLYGLPCGRYVGDIFEDDTKNCAGDIVARVQFQLDTAFWQTAIIKDDDEETEDKPVCEKSDCNCGEDDE